MLRKHTFLRENQPARGLNLRYNPLRRSGRFKFHFGFFFRGSGHEQRGLVYGMQRRFEVTRERRHFGNGTVQRLLQIHSSQFTVHHGIEAVGTVVAGNGYEFHRPTCDRPLLISTIGGAGEVLVDGVWRRAGCGTTYIAPAYCSHAYRLGHSESWSVCWVHGLDPSFLDATKTSLKEASGIALNLSIEGLLHEEVNGSNSSLMQRWLDLIGTYAHQICAATTVPYTRLHRVWWAVQENLNQPWTNKGLADLVGLSDETLRRKSLEETGMTPMRYVTHLRMKNAQMQLSTNEMSIGQIASMVGYSNLYAFSAAFKHWAGVPPGEYRRRMTRGSTTTVGLPELSK